ncbi:toxin-antitoxin system YwqK family antitoxin [Pontibacter cellulosilyticus]|uniref:Toxin-antitoxin system YwqK family antitoxin n=1 Tax=Pontibacter cellulosilyticus TaxID=1720253 RepID=A0A923N9N1_9BACT|nr:toxin-antitoxin system YwqK family antitoxin [Pontibacter cellulosilyticus]MBC5994347.1 toxin-antitoxin system YwqK family antitoxin [Pontibacter cellulosilyticus]
MTESERSIFKLIAFVIVGLCFVGCDNTEKMVWHYPNGQVEVEGQYKDGMAHGKQVEYYPSGKVKGVSYFVNGKREGKTAVYYENGNPKSNVTFNRGVMIDTAKYFHESGVLEQSVPFKRGRKNGWVDFYDREGNLVQRHEYFSQGDQEHQNQYIVFDEKGRIDADSSVYITLKSSANTVKLGESYRLLVKLETPLMGSKGKMEVHIGNFNEEYRLGKNSIRDTVKGKNNFAIVLIEPKRRGRHRVRGRVVNYVVNDSKEEQPEWLKREVHIYFTKEYYVL